MALAPPGPPAPVPVPVCSEEPNFMVSIAKVRPFFKKVTQIAASKTANEIALMLKTAIIAMPTFVIDPWGGNDGNGGGEGNGGEGGGGGGSGGEGGGGDGGGGEGAL